MLIAQSATANLRYVLVVLAAALVAAPVSAQNTQLNVVPNVSAGTHTICSSGALELFGSGTPGTGGGCPSGTSTPPPPPPPPPPCGDPANPWQNSNPVGDCYAACGSPELPYQTTDPNGACYDCGSSANPWQNTDSTAACYAACGSTQFPWQSTDSGAACYEPCGSTRFPWQNTDATGTCYAPCGTTQFPWQNDDATAGCYAGCGTSHFPWQNDDSAEACYALCGSTHFPWQTTDPDDSCYDCGSSRNPWQNADSTAACYATCGSAESPWQTTNPAGACYDCGSSRNPWQNTDSTAACYAACGSTQFPWQTNDAAAACYDCGSSRNPWQNAQPSAGCYQPCGSTQFPWQTTDPTAPCYQCGSAQAPWQDADPGAPCYREPGGTPSTATIWRFHGPPNHSPYDENRHKTYKKPYTGPHLRILVPDPSGKTWAFTDWAFSLLPSNADWEWNEVMNSDYLVAGTLTESRNVKLRQCSDPVTNAPGIELSVESETNPGTFAVWAFCAPSAGALRTWQTPICPDGSRSSPCTGRALCPYPTRQRELRTYHCGYAGTQPVIRLEGRERSKDHGASCAWGPWGAWQNDGAGPGRTCAAPSESELAYQW